jgi:uncharacterized protein (TIGR03437 family)
MDYTPKRAARFRHLLTFAALALQYANLAHATAPDISFTPATLDFQYQAGAALPASQTLQVKSTGAALAFTLSVTGPVPYFAQWLSLSGNSGTTPASFKVYVNPSGLPSGSYTGTIMVAATGALASPYSFPVTLEVADAPSTLISSAATLTFAYMTGSAPPAPQTIVLMSSGDALSASITVSGGTWLTASPTGSITLVGLPGTVTVTVNPAGLPPGAYAGKITFASPTAVDKSLIVNVALNIAAGTPTVSGVWPPGVLVNSTAVIATLTGTNYFPTSVASISVTSAAVPPVTTVTTLTTTVLSPTAMLVAIPATLLTTVATLPIVITTPTALAPSTAANFSVYGPGPQLWAVADAASYAVSNVSPGEIITIFGIGLGPAALTMYNGASLTDNLPAVEPYTSVTIDGISAPILYTSANQVSCIAPYALATPSGPTVDLVLTYNSIASAPFTVNAVAADPGVFSMDASGAGQGAILNFNAVTGDYTVNSSSNGAVKGNIVVIYVTGFGQTSPAGDESSLIAAGTPVVPVAAVGATIGGQAVAGPVAQAPVGSVPGVLQINATVPLTVTSGPAVPVLVTVTPTGGPAVTSQAKVTMAVK